MNQRILLIAALLGFLVQASTTWAQSPAPSLTSEEQPIRVTVEPVYQRYVDDTHTLSQGSTQLTAIVPATRRIQVHLRSGYATATLARESTSPGGEGASSSVQGLSDVQAALVYARPVGEGSLVLALDANIPIGKEELTGPELRTTVFVSQNVYDFRVPGFGRGFNLAPGITWAFPAGEDVVVGLGATYRYQGSYRPFVLMEGRYNPGDEVEVFGGIEVRFSRTSALSADVAYARYGTDRVGGIDRLDPGNRITATVQYLLRSGYNTVRVVTRYQNWAKSSLQPVALNTDDPRLGKQQVVPSQASVLASFRTRLRPWMWVTARAEGHRFEGTTLLDAKTTGVFRLVPAFRLSGAVTLAPTGAYTLGSFSGFSAGLRTTVRF